MIMKQKTGGKIALLGAAVFIVSLIIVAYRCDVLLVGTAVTGAFTVAIGLGIMCWEEDSNE